MKKILFLLFTMTVSLGSAWAQDQDHPYTVQGKIVDKKTNEPVLGATIQLLKVSKRDTTFSAGMATEKDGTFFLATDKLGNYILRVSYVGYTTRNVPVNISLVRPDRNLGTLSIAGDAILMKQAVVTAQATKVEVKADTFVYNTAAYRLPEGSVMEELIKQLPGAEVSDDGTIKINGKTVKKFLMNGKEFFGTDTKVAMKNVPTEMVEKIKAYDKQSDQARMTGVDDGEEETVLDMSVKKGMNKGYFANIDGAYGTEKRYAIRGMGNYFNEDKRVSLIGSANNTNDQGFSGGGGGFRGGGGGGGLTASKTGGIDFALNNGKDDRDAGYLDFGGNVNVSHSNSDSRTLSNSENFFAGTNSTFSNSTSASRSYPTSVNANFRLEWKPDSFTTIMFRPSFSYSHSKSTSNSGSVTFNKNPYDYMTDPVNEFYQHIDEASVVNNNVRQSLSSGNNTSANASLLINRRLSTSGRNVNLNLRGGWGESSNHSYSLSNIWYYQGAQKGKNTYQNQYNNNPQNNYNLSARISYNEPLFKGATLQTSYQFSYRFTDSDRSMYSLDKIMERMHFLGYSPADSLLIKAQLDNSFGSIPYDILQQLGWDLEQTRNIQNSQYATYKYYNHDIQVMFRYNANNITLHAGLTMQPQYTKLDYIKNGVEYTPTRHVFNMSPRVRFRYKISNVSNINFNYNGSASQPSMTNLLEVVDNSNPLNVSMGNPGLRPSWNNNFRLDYNGYNTDAQRGWGVGLNYSQTYNSISNATFYNPVSGARASLPMNIDGNWNAGGNLMFNTALDANRYFDMNSYTGASFSNSVGYSSAANVDRDFSAMTYDDFNSLKGILTDNSKSVTKSTNISERLSFNFRYDIFYIGLNGSINYNHSRNSIMENANLDTYTFAYGGNAGINFDFGLSLTTNIAMNSRRGYSDATMNTNELLWNAQISQSFLRGKPLTVSFQWNDILAQQSNISRSISASQRSDSWHNGIYSYGMLHVIYKFNLFGSKEARRNMRRGGDFDGPAPDGKGPGSRGGGEGRGGMRGGGSFGGGGGFGGGGRM